MELQTKALVLKKYECFCYQAAFFLLECEQDAVNATQEALLELGRDPLFFSDPETLQKQKAKAAVMRHSLDVRRRIQYSGLHEKTR